MNNTDFLEKYIGKSCKFWLMDKNLQFKGLQIDFHELSDGVFLEFKREHGLLVVRLENIKGIQFLNE